MSAKQPVAARDIYLAPVNAADEKAGRKLTAIDRITTDRTIVGANASLIIEADWAAMVRAAGSEAALLAELKVTSDAR